MKYWLLCHAEETLPERDDAVPPADKGVLLCGAAGRRRGRSVGRGGCGGAAGLGRDVEGGARAEGRVEGGAVDLLGVRRACFGGVVAGRIGAAYGDGEVGVALDLRLAGGHDRDGLALGVDDPAALCHGQVGDGVGEGVLVHPHKLPKSQFSCPCLRSKAADEI